jgi:hypothetical protein
MKLKTVSLILRLMGGERHSTMRIRLAGKICCACKIGLPPPHAGREAYCVRCQPVHRVYMRFELRAYWAGDVHSGRVALTAPAYADLP